MMTVDELIRELTRLKKERKITGESLCLVFGDTAEGSITLEVSVVIPKHGEIIFSD